MSELNKKARRRSDYASKKIAELFESADAIATQIDTLTGNVSTLDDYVNGLVSEENGNINASALRLQLVSIILASSDFADFQTRIGAWMNEE